MKPIVAALVLLASTGGVPTASVCEKRPASAVAAGATTISSARIAGDRHAGLIIESPEGTRQFCIAFTEGDERAGFDGIDLLQRAGIPVVLGGTRDLASVCRIGDTGCRDPGDCFCQCRQAGNDSCRFWGYYTLGASGTWSFAQTSASLRPVRDGDVDGWRFGDHAGGDGNPPGVPATRCANVSTQPVAASPTRPAGASGRVGAGMLVAAVVALAFAGGIVYGVRKRGDAE